MLWEKTEFLAGEPFGGDEIVDYVLEDYVPDHEKKFERVLERLHMQVEQLDIEKYGFSPKDVAGLEELLSRLSALEAQVDVIQGQELESEEIDLTKPQVLEKT